MPKLDEQQYEAGREAFKSGATIRSVVEKFDATGDLPGVLESPDDEVATMSFALGFGDAFLDQLRGIKR
jgi:hypothetical protein